jgi:hypothetical protein
MWQDEITFEIHAEYRRYMFYGFVGAAVILLLGCYAIFWR